MSTEVPRKVNRDIETPTARQTAANVLAGSDEEKAKIEGRKHISGRTAAIALSLLTAAGVGAGAAAAEYASSHPSTPEAKPTDHAAPAPTNSGDVLPTATATPSSIDLAPTAGPSPSSISTLENQQPKTFELKAGQNPEEVGTNVAGLVDTWGMDGATPGLGTTDAVLRTPLKTVAQNIAAQNTPEMAAKILGPNYQQKMASNPRVQTFVTNMQANNAANIEAFVHTDNTGLSPSEANPNNIEAWKQTMTFESVKSSTTNSDGSKTDAYAVKEANNRAMNIYAASTGSATQEDILTVTYKPEGTSLDITDISLNQAPQQ